MGAASAAIRAADVRQIRHRPDKPHFAGGDECRDPLRLFPQFLRLRDGSGEVGSCRLVDGGGSLVAPACSDPNGGDHASRRPGGPRRNLHRGPAWPGRSRTRPGQESRRAFGCIDQRQQFRREEPAVHRWLWRLCEQPRCGGRQSVGCAGGQCRGDGRFALLLCTAVQPLRHHWDCQLVGCHARHTTALSPQLDRH